MKSIIALSVWMGENKIDWLRTIYFSLFGSSALTYAQKFKTLEIVPSILFLLGVAFFLLGLVFSMIISDSFKSHTKIYLTANEETKKSFKNVDEYIFNKENRILKYFQHLSIYLLLPLAIFVIGVSSCQIEKKASIIIKSEKLKLEQNEITKTKSLEKINQEIYELKKLNLQLMDSLRKISMRNSNDCHARYNDNYNESKKVQKRN